MKFHLNECIYKFRIIEGQNPICDLPLADECVDKIRSETIRDSTFNKTKHYIIYGWPNYISDVPEDIKVYFQFKDELTTFDNLILRNNLIVIPYGMRKDMIKKIHTSHSGVESCLKLAREAFFWPSMSADIKLNIQHCGICAKYLPKQRPFPMQSHEIPSYPWQFISMDVFFIIIKGKQMKYLVTVDHYSDYFELDNLKNLSAAAVIKKCKRNFARHGIPERVCTDGGTNFVCSEFQAFARTWNFTHVTSSPNHPQGNGKAESAVKIAKRLIYKANDSGEDMWFSLLHWRNTPNKINSSPVQRLYSRRTRTSLPMIREFYKPAIIEKVPITIENKRRVDKYFYDKKSIKPPKLEIGQPVVVQLQPANSNLWSPGIVEEQLSDRAYIVNVNDTSYRRDLSHIRTCRDHTKINQKKNQSFEDDQKNDTNISSEAMLMEDSTISTGSDQTIQDISQPKDTGTTGERPKRLIKPPAYLSDYVRY